VVWPPTPACVQRSYSNLIPEESANSTPQSRQLKAGKCRHEGAHALVCCADFRVVVEESRWEQDRLNAFLEISRAFGNVDLSHTDSGLFRKHDGLSVRGWWRVRVVDVACRSVLQDGRMGGCRG
jgi:hypothetical protein